MAGRIFDHGSFFDACPFTNIIINRPQDDILLSKNRENKITRAFVIISVLLSIHVVNNSQHSQTFLNDGLYSNNMSGSTKRTENNKQECGEHEEHMQSTGQYFGARVPQLPLRHRNLCVHLVMFPLQQVQKGIISNTTICILLRVS
jgi:hypothetical protein